MLLLNSIQKKITTRFPEKQKIQFSKSEIVILFVVQCSSLFSETEAEAEAEVEAEAEAETETEKAEESEEDTEESEEEEAEAESVFEGKLIIGEIAGGAATVKSTLLSEHDRICEELNE